MFCYDISQLEKVPMGIQVESREKTQVRENWSQQFEHNQVLKGREWNHLGVRNCPCLHATPVENAPCQPLVIR